MRVILHVDLDYFYAQIEERDNPSFKDKPVLVLVLSGRTEESGVIATANYAARKYGVRAGIPIAIAKRKLQGIESVLIPIRIEYYKFISEEIMETLHDNSDIFEQASIDEAYLDVTTRVNQDFYQAYNFAKKIQNEIYNKVRLTCSIGIGPNKLIAKIASGKNKPNGITIVKPSDIKDFLSPLSIKEIPGVGEKTSSRLAELGIKNIEDLVKFPLDKLNNLFGKKIGLHIFNSSRGIDDSPVASRGVPSQHSRIRTLKEDTRELNYIVRNIMPLVEKIDSYLNKHQINFKTVSVIFITTDLKAHTKSKTLDHTYTKLGDLQLEIRTLIQEFLEEVPKQIRRVGIRASNFVTEKNKKQTTLKSFIL